MVKLNSLVSEHQLLDTEMQQMTENLTGQERTLHETEQANKEVRQKHLVHASIIHVAPKPIRKLGTGFKEYSSCFKRSKVYTHSIMINYGYRKSKPCN